MTILTQEIPAEFAEKRLNQAMAALFPDYSRNQHQQWIKQNQVTLDDKTIDSTKLKVKTGQILKINAVLTQQVTMEAEAIPLEMVYEDDAGYSR